MDKSISKDTLWLELLNHGYSLGDRILNFSNPVLKGSDIEELQELLSRLGFYSEPINSEYSQELMKSVEAFQENRGLTIDGVVGLNTATEIKRSKAVGEPPFMLGISVLEALSMAISSMNDYQTCPRLDTPATPERVLLAEKNIQEQANK